MRTKTVEMVIDRGYWALLLILPMLAYLIANHHGSVDYATIMAQFNILDTNFIYTGLASIFGSGGTLEFLDTTTTNTTLLYMSYFVVLELIHIFVDVILYIPKLCIAILDKAGSSLKG